MDAPCQNRCAICGGRMDLDIWNDSLLVWRFWWFHDFEEVISIFRSNVPSVVSIISITCIQAVEVVPVIWVFWVFWVLSSSILSIREVLCRQVPVNILSIPKILRKVFRLSFEALRLRRVRSPAKRRQDWWNAAFLSRGRGLHQDNLWCFGHIFWWIR